MFPVMLLATMARYNCESVSSYHYANGNDPSQFGDFLKPPPPPLSIAPVPFHGGKPLRQNKDVPFTGYHYQTTASPSVTPIPPSSNFKFPAPFYKQYNFNFVPPPQPFTSTPSPTFFQKISGWLFPSQQTAAGAQNLNIESFKKDCNPCNLVPWVPVIKYNLGDNVQQSPTYGPPSPTALAQNVVQYRPQPFNSPSQDEKQQLLNTRHVTYGVPNQSYLNGNIFGNPSSTYGPPSATKQISISSQNPLSTVYSLSNPTYGFASPPNPTLPYKHPFTSYGVPTSTNSPSSYIIPATSYNFDPHVINTFPVNHKDYFSETLKNQSPVVSDLNNYNIVTPPVDIQLPNVSPPAGFKNSYGEDISNFNAELDIPYSITSLEAESSKIKTQVAPYNLLKSYKPNISVALAKPAPFALNKGRNIHTLQPVALPNLSVSPLPPIFNARPFRPITSTSSAIYGINYNNKPSDNVNVAQSVPVADFVHSIEYPTTIIESPVIDIDATKNSNQNKSYRNIPNSYVIDEVKDISPQASEDHILSAKVNPDVSFETTGPEIGNNLYVSNLPTDMRHNSYVPSNHRPEFADLRGVKDEDVDRYRTESNLQNIDSPLLYLKPSAPHKNFKIFVITASTPPSMITSQNEYEIYDEILTTPAPTQTATKDWNESETHNDRGLSSPLNNRENQAKVVQIIIPYITEQQQQDNNKETRSAPREAETFSTKQEEHLGRKVPSNTERPYFNVVTETSTIPSTTTEQLLTVTEEYDSELKNTPTILSDFYNYKEPAIDIIKLQHTIDDWTEQEYSNHYATPDRTRSNEKYAKQIPDEFLTTVNPFIIQGHETNDYNYEDIDHEGSSSVQHSVTDTRNNTLFKTIREYNKIERTKNKQLSEKGEDPDDDQKLRIYTAASSFRSTSTTPAPWGSIQTSISPLTKEKVYVVTSKPWRDKTETTTKIYDELELFESKKVKSNSEEKSTKNDFPFKSPRFVNRPPFGFTASGPVSLDSIKSDSSYGFSKGWYQSINNLRSLYQSDSTLSSEGPDDRV